MKLRFKSRRHVITRVCTSFHLCLPRIARSLCQYTLRYKERQSFNLINTRRGIHFLAARHALRICAKVAFLSIIITVDDYRKGQRPPQFLIIDRTAVKSFFCRHVVGSRIEYLTHFIYDRERERGGGGRRRMLENARQGVADGVAGVFATFYI